MDANAVNTKLNLRYSRFFDRIIQQLRSHWLAVIPLIAPLGIEGVRVWLANRIIGCRGAPRAGELESCLRFEKLPPNVAYVPQFTFEPSPGADLVARYEFIAVLLVSILGATVAIGICVWILRVARTSFKSPANAWAAAIGFLTALMLSSLYYASETPMPYANVVQRELWPLMPAFFDPTSYAYVRAIVSFMLFGFVGAAAGSIVLAAEKAQTPEALQSLYLRLHVLLYVGAATLAVYVIQQRVGAGWALGYAINDDVPRVARIVTAMTLTYGLASSLMLSAIYAPVAIVLNRRSSELAHIALPTAPYAERRQWAASVGLTPGVPQQLGTVLSLIGPILAGGPIDALKALF